MGIGCRNVACMALLILLGLELSSIAIVSSSRTSSIKRSPSIDENDRNLPIHRRKRSSGIDRHEIEPINVIYEVENLSFDKPFRELNVEHFDSLTVNDKGHCQQSYYTFKSPDNTRIQISFSEFNIKDNKEDVITAYSGDLTKTFLQNDNYECPNYYHNPSGLSKYLTIPDSMPFLFTSKLPIQNYSDQSNIKLNHNYVSDNNSLTISFLHNSNIYQGSMRGNFKANIQIYNINNRPNDGISDANLNKRNDEDLTSKVNNSENDEGKSVRICEQHLDSVVNNSLVSNEGTISSSKAYPEKKLEKKYQGKICTLNLKSANKNKIKINISNLNLQRTGINKNCDQDESHIHIIDKTRMNAKMNRGSRICIVGEEEKVYEFGNDIEISYYTGSWDSDGFQMTYKTVAAYVASTVGDNDDKSKTSSTKKEEVTKDDESSLADTDKKIIALTRSINYDEPHYDPYGGEEIEYNPYSDEDLNNGENKNDSSAKSLTAAGVVKDPKNNQKKFGQYIMTVSIVAVGIIICLILIGAGLVACHRTRDQEQLIKDLTEKLETTERQYNAVSVDASQNLMRQITSSNDKTNTLASLNSLEKGKYILNITEKDMTVTDRLASPDKEINPIINTLNSNFCNESQGLIGSESGEHHVNMNFNNNNNIDVITYAGVNDALMGESSSSHSS